MPKIRTATINDLQNLLVLRLALWPEQIDEENRTEMMRVLDSPDKISLFVSEDGQGDLLAKLVCARMPKAARPRQWVILRAGMSLIKPVARELASS